MFRQLIERYPDFVGAYNNLASLHLMQHDFHRAILGYEQALRINPGFFIARHNLAKALAADGQFNAADQAYQAVLQLQPRSAELYCYCEREDLHQRRGFLQQAIAYYRMAIQCQPDSAAAYNNLGAALQMQGELKRAIVCYCKVLSLDPDYQLAHFNRAQALEASGDLSAAYTHYSRALELAPDAINILYHLTYLRLKLADGRIMNSGSMI